MRLSLAALAYAISTYILYEFAGRLDLAMRVGVEALTAIVFYNSMFIASSLASTLIILYATGSVIAMSGVLLSLLLIVVSSPYRAVLLTSLLVTLIVVGALVFIQQARGRLEEPVFDFASKPRVSPTALAATAVTLYTSWSILGFKGSCELTAFIYTVSSLVAATIASLSSYTVLESLILGGLAGLGPLGLVLTAGYASLKPLKLEVCKGVEVGELIGFTEAASRSRALLPVAGEPRGSIVVCSQKSKAILELEEPWIIWVYGVESRRVAEAIALNQGGGVVLSLEEQGPGIAEIERAAREALGQALGGVARIGLGNIEPYEARIALLPSIAETLKPAKTLIVETIAVDREQTLKLAFETSRKHPRIVIALPEIPWAGEIIAPRGPAKTAAFIVTKLTDPQQAENIARTLTPRQTTHIKEALLKGDITIAHPSCKGKTIIFRSQAVKAVQGR